jgi:NAD-dependent dihydropyrimidine dehydrogenase PreA subunit
MSYKISSDCIECGSCAPECPTSAIAEGSPYTIDPSKCTDCGNCASVCPADAISQA